MASKNGYEFHPIADIFPMMEGAAYAELVADIREHGLRDSILLAEGKIADGRNRYQACIEAEVQPRFEQWDKKGSLVALVLSRNAHRRHLDRSQLAMVAAKALPFFEGEAEKRQKTGTLASKESKGKATEKAAESVGASPASVARAKTVIEKGSPELVAAVESGEVKVTDAAAIVDQPKAEQRKAVKAVQEGKAKTVKAAVQKAKPEPEPEGGFEPHEAQKPLGEMDKLLTKMMSHLSTAEKILGKPALAAVHAGLDAAYKALTKVRGSLRKGK